MTDLSILADAILSGDHVELYAAVKPYLTARDHTALAAMIELCPIHGCDLQICRDDRESCQPRITHPAKRAQHEQWSVSPRPIHPPTWAERIGDVFAAAAAHLKRCEDCDDGGWPTWHSGVVECRQCLNCCSYPDESNDAQLVTWIRSRCVEELGGTFADPFFHMNYEAGLTPDQSLVRLYREEASSDHYRGRWDRADKVVLVLCHG